MIETFVFDTDSVRHKDANGFLHVDTSHITKECVSEYRGREIDVGLEPERMFRVYRPGTELEKAASTFNGIPILFEHHPDNAGIPNKEFRIGSTGTDARYDSPYLNNSLHFTDAMAITAIEKGNYGELSCAYQFTPEWTSGVWNGEPYDCIMRDIKANHVALVSKGRVGQDVRVADAQIQNRGDSPESEALGMDKIKGLLEQALALFVNDSADSENKAPDTKAEDSNGVEDSSAAPAPAPKAEDGKAEDSGAKDAEAEERKVDDSKAGDAKADDCGKSCIKDGNINEMLSAIGNEQLATGIKAYIDNIAAASKVKDSEIAKAADSAAEQVKADMKARYAAAQDCAPLVGKVADVFAFDSATDIYGSALSAKGFDISKFPKEAYKSMVEVLKSKETAAPAQANDSAPKETGLLDMFPGLKSIRKIG